MLQPCVVLLLLAACKVAATMHKVICTASKLMFPPSVSSLSRGGRSQNGGCSDGEGHRMPARSSAVLSCLCCRCCGCCCCCGSAGNSRPAGCCCGGGCCCGCAGVRFLCRLDASPGAGPADGAAASAAGCASGDCASGCWLCCAAWDTCTRTLDASCDAACVPTTSVC